MSALNRYIASVLAQRPVTFYPGGEPSGTVFDAVSHALESVTTYNATPSGTLSARYPSGLGMGGFGWDFTNGYLQTPHHSEWGSTQRLTLEAWIRPDNWSGFQGIISKTSGNKPRPFDSYVTDATGTLSFLVGNTAGTTHGFITNETIPVGRWTHVLMQYRWNGSNTRGRMFINGEPATLSSASTTTVQPNDGSDALRIGNRNDGVTSMDGKIAFPAIYNYEIALGPVRQRVAIGRGLLGRSRSRALALR